MTDRLIAQGTNRVVKCRNDFMDAISDEVFQVVKRGQGVTTNKFDGFNVRLQRESWMSIFNPCLKGLAFFDWSSMIKVKYP
jgi:hypothetical protein